MILFESNIIFDSHVTRNSADTTPQAAVAPQPSDAIVLCNDHENFVGPPVVGFPMLRLSCPTWELKKGLVVKNRRLESREV